MEINGWKTSSDYKQVKVLFDHAYRDGSRIENKHFDCHTRGYRFKTPGNIEGIIYYNVIKFTYNQRITVTNISVFVLNDCCRCDAVANVRHEVDIQSFISKSVLKDGKVPLLFV